MTDSKSTAGLLRERSTLVIGEGHYAVPLDLFHRAVRELNAFPDLVKALERAQEEMRLIRMKDCDAVYDTTLRMEIELLLSRAKGEQP